MTVLKIIKQLTAYGTTTPSLFISESFLRNRTSIATTSQVNRALVLKFFIGYFSSIGPTANKYFLFLTARRKTYSIAFNSYGVFSYNYIAVKAVVNACSFLFNALEKKKRILFICDAYTENNLAVRELNYLLWPKSTYPMLDDISKIEYYYSDWNRSTVASMFDGQHIDIAVFCSLDYTKITKSTLQKIAKVTIGVSTNNIRPDIFDYFVPASSTYEYTVKWICGLVLLNHKMNTF